MKSLPKTARSATLAVHAGEAPDQASGAIAPSIVTSTNFVADAGGVGFSAADSKDGDPYFYSRWSTPTVRALELKLAALDGGEDAVCFASGMAAASALLLHKLKAGDHLLVSDVCYAGVAEFVRDSLPRYGIAVTAADFSDPADVAGALRPNTRLLWAETPANPILKLTDLAALATLAHQAGAELAVDSTLAPPPVTQPLGLGVDYVVHSLTKYVNGHGDALGGAVIGPRSAMARLRQDTLVHVGGALSPFNAFLILRGAHTLSLRMRAHSEHAQVVASFLADHPAVTALTYPGLPSHPQQALAQRQMKLPGGMLAFRTANGPATARRLAERCRVFHYAVSLGKQKSVLFYIPTADILRSSFRLTGEAERRYRDWAGDGVFRVSVGLEDPADLIEDLAQALGQ